MHKNLKEYIDRQRDNVLSEMKAEEKRHVDEIMTMSANTRQSVGRAILNLRMRRSGKTPLGHQKITFFREQFFQDGLRINVGDMVIVSHGHPLNQKGKVNKGAFKGTVERVGGKVIIVSFDERIRGLSNKRPIRLDLYMNLVTYDRMLDALRELGQKGNTTYKTLLGERQCRVEGSVFDTSEYSLNKSQQDAISKAIGANYVSLIQGPPGTGKTTTLAAYIQIEMKKGNRVLVTADSNGAVDELMRKLIANDVPLLRVGNPAKVNMDIMPYTLEEKLQVLMEGEQYKALLANIDQQQALIETLPRPEQRYLRGLNFKEVLKLAKEGKGTRGVPAAKLQEMVPYINEREKLDAYYQELDALKQAYIDELFEQYPIICATNSMAGSTIIKGRAFDILVLDEASQCTQASAIIPMNRAKKVIVCGDQKQLPPTVISDEALKKGMGISILEYLLGYYPIKMLKVQYRMHPDILKLSNRLFYDNQIECADEVRRSEVKGAHVTTFVDVQGQEQKGAQQFSYYNDEEIQAIIKQFKVLIDNGYKANEIGIISPYAQQCLKIREQLSNQFGYKGEVLRQLVNTVDGFQGQEREVILYSCVRSNSLGNMGFLTDYRRLNVAITRAKHQLMMFGSKQTLQSDHFYNQVIQLIEK